MHRGREREEIFCVLLFAASEEELQFNCGDGGFANLSNYMSINSSG